MAREDMGGGMTSDDVMLQRTRWLFEGGPVPPGLEEQAKEVRRLRVEPDSIWTYCVRRFTSFWRN